MEAYLDNSATTRCLESVKDVVVKTMMEDYGNPSSKHEKGMLAERYLRDAREKIAGTLKVNEKEIFFTSGGTESNNWALIGTAMANKRAGNHIITTVIEHPAVLQPMAYLAEQGFRITYIPVDSRGILNMDALRKALCEETILVSVMYVNNEIGSVQPIAEIGKLLKDIYPWAVFHVDAIQAYGKYRIFPKKIGIDLLSVSAHKIHGPKGVGFLYINEKVKIHPIIFGGGQQRGMRSGTDNVPGAAGLAAAAREAYRDLEAKTAHLCECRSYFTRQAAGIPGIVFNSRDDEQSAPHIVSIGFCGVRSEVLLHALEERGISVSSGSACSSNKKIPVSSVLKEINVPKDMLESAVRFSFSIFTTKEELDYCLESLNELLPVLRKYSRH